MARRVNKRKTAENIVNTINRKNASSSRFDKFSIDIKKLRQKMDDEEFLKGAAKFVGAKVVYESN